MRQPTPSVLTLIGAPSGIPGIAAAPSDDPPGRPSWTASAGGPSRPEAARHLGLSRAPAGPGGKDSPFCLAVGGQPSGKDSPLYLVAIPNCRSGRALAVPNQCGSPGCTQHPADVSAEIRQSPAGNHFPRPKTIPQHFTLVTVHSLPPPVSADSACRCARTYPPVSAPHPLHSCWSCSRLIT